MDDPNPPVEGHHHETARQRQRRGPMWGCLRWIVRLAIGVLVLLFLVIGGGYFYLGTKSFGELVRLRVERTLEARLGRDVTIGSVEVVRSRPNKVILRNVSIANSPGAVHPHFATVKQVTITGGIDSFWGRDIRVSRIDIDAPQLFFEIYPAGSSLVHNFPHWNSGPKGKYEIYHLALGTMYVTNGAFEFLDRRHDLAATSTQISSTINITSKENLYAGLATSPLLRVRIQNYVPFDTDLRAQFRYTPGVLELSSVALNGRDMRIFLNGKLDPLTDGVYNLRVRSHIGLERVREIFAVQKTLEGAFDFDANLKGKQGNFTMAGAWVSPRIRADVYELTNARGQLSVSDTRTVIDVQRASYGAGTIAAHYVLPQYAEPYPMSVDLRYNNVSIEKLFADWGIEGTGLRGGATGQLSYHWNKDRVLAGAGEGTATLSKSAAVFSNAQYPIPLAGSANFALDSGVVTFRPLNLETDASRISVSGKLRIEDVYTDFLVNIHSTDFSELDRAGFNFAHSAGKKTYTLLGLGGAGDITGSVKGKLKTPQVVAKIAGSGLTYNNVRLGDGDIDMRYDGSRSVLTFDRAVFREGNGQLALTGTVAFPDRGPSPVFDIALEATNYPVDRAIAAVNLKLAISGIGTGRAVITGSPEEGKVTFAGLTIREGTSTLRLNGTSAWSPGKGNVNFNLDIAAQSFPVSRIVKFLDLGTLPVSGNVTGDLHLEGPKAALGGRGTVTVTNGEIYGEPVTKASANIVFTQGTMKATDVQVASPAGTVTGQAEFNLSTNQFSYSIASSSIDLSKIKALSALAGMLGGNLTLSSTGAGTMEQPEVVLTATLNQATLRGLNFPADAPPPQLYIALRNGQLVVRGSAADILSIDGTGSVAADGALSGSVQIRIADLARALALSPNTAGLPASGKLTANLQLGGNMKAFETLRIDATFPEFDVNVSEHQFAPAEPLHIALRDGRIVFDSFQLALEGMESQFGVKGDVELTGAKRLNIDLRGTLEAALLQLFMPGARADGHVSIAGGVRGTLATPQFSGTAEIRDAQVRFPGFPQLIDHITATLVFKGDSVDVDSLSATLGGGTVTAGGTVALNGLMPKSARLSIHGKGVAIRYFEGLTLEGDFDLRLSGGIERMALTGDGVITRALYFRDIDIGAALLNAVLSRRGVMPIVSASWQDKVALNVHLTSNDTLAVRNNIADFTGGGELQVAGTLANPTVLGNITLDEGGRVRFQDVDYTLTRGSITFQNPFRIDPYFDITLEGRVNGGFSDSQDTGPIQVTVNITGTFDKFTPAITSDPPTSDITLFSLLGLGALASQTGASQTPAAVGGRSLLFTSISKLIGQRVLPFVDTFTFDPSSVDTASGGTGAKVTFEKRLGNNLSVAVVYYLEDHRQREMIDWRINSEWALQFIRDEVRNEYRMEARYRRPFQGHWVWGSRGRNPMTLFARFHDQPNPAPASTTTAVQPQQASVAPPVAPTGPVVASVNFRADSRFDTAALSQYVSVRTGAPLSIREVQSSIKALHGTGDFRDVRVESTTGPSGVNITFALFINYRVANIRFHGIKNADRDRALRNLTIHVGDVFSDDALEHSASAIEDFLRRTGYLQATVDPESAFVREQGRADVTFTVTQGPRANVGSVVISGDIAPFTPAQLTEQMRRGPGRVFQVNDARLDADRMQRFMIRRDHRKADVRYTGEVYDEKTNTVTLQYRATAGPVVKVAVDGPTTRAIRRLIPFSRNQAYSEDVIDRAANDVLTNLQQDGYFNAAVDTDESLDGNVWTTTFHIRPGQQYRLTEVTFSGNATVPDKKLAEVVTTSPGGGVRSLLSRIFRRSTGATRAQLSADRDALESYYLLNGYSLAAVATPIVNTKADGTMTVDFPITEGPQTIVSSVVVEGAEQAVNDLPVLELKAGDPLNPQVERNDIVALQSFYGDRGNAEVQIKVREEVSADKKSAKVAYVVAEGPKINIDEVVVRGNTYTNTNVILRQSQLKRGAPFSYTSLLEAQRNLYRLGIFQRVDVQPEQAGTSVSDRNVVISVAEGRDLTVAGAIGLGAGINRAVSGSRVSIVGEASIAHRNLFGTGRYLGLQLVQSHNDERNERLLTFREPAIGRFDVPVQVSIFQSNDLRRGAQVNERGFSVEASRVAFQRTRWSLRYEYRRSDCTPNGNDVCAQVKSGVLPPGVDRTIGKINISSLTPTFFWDDRDDPVNPTRGFFTSASVRWAVPFLNADAHLLKEFVQGSWYQPISTGSTFVVSGRAGLLKTLGGADLPLTERFTAGGDTSHRAYGLDLLGTICADPLDRSCRPTLVAIDGGIAPLGGNAVFLANAEYRFPVFASVGGALFVDAGNTFAGSSIQFGDLRYGVGAGIRYLSPVGPLRLDFGYKLKRQRTGVDSYERPYAVFLTIGYPF
jgi:outer membrane protein assembly complex protein YaeT